MTTHQQAAMKFNDDSLRPADEAQHEENVHVQIFLDTAIEKNVFPMKTANLCVALNFSWQFES